MGDTNAKRTPDVTLVCDRGRDCARITVPTDSIDITSSGHTDVVCRNCGGPMVVVEWPPVDDARFNFGLVHEVVEVLVRRGYRGDQPTDAQPAKLHVRVHQALFDALYGEGSDVR